MTYLTDRNANLYTSDGTHYQTTNIIGMGWTKVGQFTSGNNPQLSGMVGGALPWDQNQNRFYAIGGNGKLQESGLNGGSWSPNGLTFGVSPVGQTQTPTAAAIYQAGSGAQYIVRGFLDCMLYFVR